MQRIIALGVLVCLLAWLMAVVDLDARSMWIDEYHTWSVSEKEPVGVVQMLTIDVHPPVYFWWVWAWRAFTGSENLFLMRLTAAIPAVLAVALCYRLGRRWFNTWVGFSAAAFLATSGLFINYARELRMYALVVLLVLVSWWFWDRLIASSRLASDSLSLRSEEGRGYRTIIPYALSLILMAYTYYYAAFIVLIQIIVTLIYFRGALRRLALAGGIAVLAFLPWFPTFINQLGTARAQSGDTTNTPIIGKFLGTEPTNLKSISEFIDMYSAGQPAFIALLVILGLTLAFSRSRRQVIIISLWFFLTVFLFFALNLVIPIYGLRYVLIVLPALALLVGVAVYYLPNNYARVAVILLIVGVSLLNHPYAFQVDRAPHRELFHTLSTRYVSGDRIWYNPPLGAAGSDLSAETGYHLKLDAPSLNTDWFVWSAPDEFEDPAVRVWDVRPYWVPVPESAESALTNSRTVSRQYGFGAYTIRLYEAPPSDGTPIVFNGTLEMLPGVFDGQTLRPGEVAVAKTWWRALEQPSVDYSYVLLLRDPSGATIAQVDSALVVGGQPTPNGLDTLNQSSALPTSQWTDTYELGTPQLTLPSDLPPGEYELWLGVYDWQDPTRLPVDSENSDVVDSEQNLARIATFTVISNL